uniref:uncharacterized protein n=1 Tax=Myxine glutinosa TaxID=7769 RepID=UPI00358EE98D
MNVLTPQMNLNKMTKTATERQRERRRRLREDDETWQEYLKSDRDRKAFRRGCMDSSELHTLKRRGKLATEKWRVKKGMVGAPKKDQSCKTHGPHGTYKSNASFGRARRRAENALPYSPNFIVAVKVESEFLDQSSLNKEDIQEAEGDHAAQGGQAAQGEKDTQGGKAGQERDELSDDPEEGGQTTQGPKKKRTRGSTYIFTDRQEVDLAEWYRENECFYNKKLKAFKNTEMKRRLLEEKAARLEPPCTYQQLKTLFESMRTRYGKITALKSGQGAVEELSERDQTIYNTYRFLDTHIKRCPSRQSAKFPKGAAESNKSAATTSQESQEEEAMTGTEDDDVTEMDAPPPLPSLDDKPDQRVAKGKGEDKSTPDSDEMIARRADKAAELRKSLATHTVPKFPHEEAVQQFVGYISTQLRQIRREDWCEFSMEAMRLMNDFVTRGQQPASYQEHVPPDMSYQQQQQYQQPQQYGYVMPPPSTPPRSYTTMRSPAPRPLPPTPSSYVSARSPAYGQQQQPSFSATPVSSFMSSASTSQQYSTGHFGAPPPSQVATGKETPEATSRSSDVMLSSTIYDENI